ncbi:hypothetical protein HW130_25520 [Streptomyces sp. PKU-EA00015]|uniref:hypothetical protein n=1 Tax=Streptomyces sp. PKU-EA00015 TaxID=2748326 RepID=UPI0015A2682A|nr:hypothetical protein [Streptomyces sp. PKU-EA00015]NWF29572.1 hypothetical protein [Streptomyces sp. PKU-EA00015]
MTEAVGRDEVVPGGTERIYRWLSHDNADWFDQQGEAMQRRLLEHLVELVSRMPGGGMGSEAAEQAVNEYIAERRRR